MTNIPYSVTKQTLNNPKKMFIFGKTGAGKTHLASTAKNCVIMNFERATQCLTDYEIPMIEPQHMPYYEAVEYYFKALSNEPYFETIIVDSYSRMTMNMFEQFKPMYKDMRLVYSYLSQKLKDFSELVMNCPKNVVLLAHDINTTDEAGRIYPVINVAGWAKTSIQTMDNGEVLHLGFVDLVARLVTEKKDDKLVRFLQTEHEPESGYYCRDKTGKLLPQEEPNLDLIINKMKGLSI